MKKQSMLFVILLVCTSLIEFTSCERIDDLNANVYDAINVLDNGINMMDTQSRSWNETLNYISSNMPEGMHNFREEIQALINDSNGVIITGIVCMMDAIPTRVLNQLRRMRTQLQEGYLPRLCPTICEASINEIDLGDNPEIWRKIAFYGYDFPSTEYMYLILVNNNGQEIGLPPNRIISPLPGYQVVVSIGGIQNTLSQYNKLVLLCDNTVVSEISIVPD